MNNYAVIDILGEGAYGMVLKARHKITQNVVAIKKFKETDDEELIKKTTVREIQVLRALKHKNIVELHEAFKKKGLVHLVF
jgi:cyclin-dependent kinase-like